ncbi:surfeit locus 1 family protein [Sphingomonas guangdongensis]|uniref:SURF1-like protein n=1 Tax=Sphingomonas guangdongensis TaxID=1141890 RepID=A0A285QDI4_9SPHN|nr:SURF1 family protein [Sphingomonas guangdongensis]SOB79588.1 surfeit locus 1 family protein [Sphingomonas guangdongensis]
MKRLPIIPTIIVAIAIAVMIGLGVWQLQRRGEKEAALTRLAANVERPPIAFPAAGSGNAALFRRSSLTCSRATNLRLEGGRSADGGTGWRVLADCPVEAGRVAVVQLGIAGKPDARPAWAGGVVTGHISYAPDARPLLSALYDRRPRALMLVANPPLAGLRANPGPDLSAVPNNHLAYAGQWFLFAGIAAVIYALALRRRARS